MSRQSVFYHWHEQLVNAFAQPGALSRPQVYGLAMLSFGIVCAGSCALTAVAGKLSFLGSDNTVLQRLKYWLRDGRAKRTPRAPQIEVRTAFPLLIAWVLSLWQGVQLTVAFDSTTLHDDLVVLALSLLYRGTAIPLAWAFLPANRKQAWMPLILDLCKLVAGQIPPRYEGLFLADRGLYSPRLYRSLRHRHWHVLLRVNNRGSFRCRSGAWQRVAHLLPGPGQQWRGRGQYAKRSRLACTLLAFWGPGQPEPWFLVTDLRPQRAQATWYGLRVWVEEGFRVLKSLGWQWQKSRITDPQRGERLWLALAVATVWTLAEGTWVEDQRKGPPPAPAPAAPASSGREGVLEAVDEYVPPTRPRTKSIFRQGCERLTESLCGEKPFLRHLRLAPEPLPGGRING